jgi:HAD superfamily hydrolase (TIGR01490 family)
VEAAFFDLDKTVIAKASMVAFSRPFYREGLISRRTILRALYGQLVYMHLGASEEKLTRVRESALRLTKGWEQTRVKEIVRDALENVIDPIIYREAADLIEEHKAAGREVYLVSASPDEIVAPLAEYLRVDGAIASRARIDEEGRYSGDMDRYAYGPFKADAMRELAAERGIDLAESYAYSDSYTDAPMLEVVGHPFAVNPDRVLAKLARERDWGVLTFTQPVRLRDRVPMPPPGPTAAVGGALVAGATGALVWWRILKARRRPARPASTFARIADAWPPRRRGQRR